MADVFDTIQAKLDDPTPLMAKIGALTVRTSVESFRLQKLGDLNWSAKYGGRGTPFINVAGAIEDFSSGKTSPAKDRLVATPALVGQGNRGGLKASISFEVLDPRTVQVGSNKPYANLMQKGGPTSVTLTTGGYKNLMDWLGTSKKVTVPQPAGQKSKKVPASSYMENVFIRRIVREGVASNFAPYVHNITIVPRPFVGIPDQLRAEILETVRRFFSGGTGKVRFEAVP